MSISTKHRRKDGELEFKMLLAVTLPMFLIITIIKRVMPWNWARDQPTVFAATRSAAYNSIPFAFM